MLRLIYTGTYVPQWDINRLKYFPRLRVESVMNSQKNVSGIKDEMLAAQEWPDNA